MGNIRVKLFISIVLLFTQCKAKSNYVEFKTNHINANIDYTVTHKNIQLPDSANFDQFIAYQQDTNLTIVYFNYHSNTIDFINFNQNKFLKSIPLNTSEFPLEENINVGSIYSKNQDSILLLTENYFVIIDSVGKIIYKDAVNLDLQNNTYKKNIFENLSKSFSIYAYNNKIYFPQRSYQYSLRTKEFYNTPVEAYIDLGTNATHELPLKYPALYTDNFYGYLDFCYREAHDSLGILSFMADPNIYIYNYNKNNYAIVGGKSSYQEKIKPLKKEYKNNSNRLIEYYVTSPFYSKILWDKYRKLYYRFFYNGLNIKNIDGTYNCFADKDIILMIFDNNFNLLKEIKLTSHTYTDTRAFVAKEGLFLPKQNIFFKQNKLYNIQYDVYHFKTK